MFDSDALLDSVGGSLLNDLLSDLNAAVDASNKKQNDDGRSSSNATDDGGDDLFALLERELASTMDAGVASGPPPPGMMESSAAALVVNQQQGRAARETLPPGLGGGGDDDAWSSALSQFGGMSLAADFLAADATSKKQDPVVPMADLTPVAAPPGVLPADKLFEEDDYALEGEAKLDDGVAGGGLAALLGMATSREAAKASGAPDEKSSEAKKEPEAPAPPVQKQQPQRPPPTVTEREPPLPPPGHGPPPGPMMFPPHAMMMPPPGAMPPGMPPGMMMPPGMPQGMMPPGMPPGMMMPPNMPPQGMMPPHPAHPMMPPPPQHNHQPGMRPHAPPQRTPQGGGGLSSKDFPALGSAPDKSDINEEKSEEKSNEEKTEEKPEYMAPSPRPVAVAQRAYFNDTNPRADPVDSKRVASRLMPPRDVTYIVHAMIRPLQSLDAYNDDYYHFSMAQRRSQMGGGAVPVSKDVKAVAQKSEDRFQDAVKDRARAFAEEKKSLGQMVRTNVKRPKALLTTPVLHKEENADEENDAEAVGAGAGDAKYESEVRRNRISVWKARVAIDRGYGAFLSLIELRRLIQANGGSSPQLINDLMGDVKTNVDRLHSSLGIAVRSQQEGGGKKEIEVDGPRLGSVLSLPKGRALCARVIEDGILPHPSACRVLPAALRCVLSRPVAAPPNIGDEGEDRLLRALTGLVRTPRPGVDPAMLLRCLDELTASGDGSAITGGRARMELVHSILSVGKDYCANGPMEEAWAKKETAFLEMLKGGAK